MKYMLFVCVDDSFVPPKSLEPETVTWVEEMDRRGVRLLGDRLRPAREATTVRVRGNDVLRSAGPFAAEQGRIAGFDIVECADLEMAIDVAAKHPMARLGMIEVRPFWSD